MQKHYLFLLLTFFCSIFFANAQTPDANGIVYVNINVSGGNGTGNSWANATKNLQAAINANGVTKVFVAVGNYPSPTNGFVMKNNVAIYGGFNPGAGITTLAHSRIMPTETTEGTVLTGDDERRVIYNDNNGLNSSAVLDGFTINRGTAKTMIDLGDTGGGIFNYYSSPTLRNLVVKSCYAATAGGGIANINSSSIISNTLFLSNFSGKGGAVYSQNSNTVINYTVFKSNTASQNYGSVIYTDGGTATLTNSLMAENYYNFWVISAGSANITFNNVTLVGRFNASMVMDTRDNGAITANNSIIYGNVYGNYTEQNTFRKDFSGYENADIDINDIFTNLSAGDYSLKPHPAVIDKGNNTLFPSLDANTKDLAGNPRLIGATIDLGAYEYIVVPDANGIAYVMPNGSGNGSSWSNATNSLQKAIDAAGTQQVYVGVGNYNVGTSSFIMKNGVKIYGGFDPANNNTSFANRIKPTETTDGSVLNGLNTRPVIWNDNNGLTNTSVLDGFTIKGGYTNGANAGAGITNKGVSPIFNNLVIRDNIGKTALNSGGMLNYQSSAVVSNTLFLNNKADNYAGAVFNHSTGQSSYTNVIFKGNQAPGGAAMFNYANNPVLTNVLISGNKGDNIIDVSEITGSGITMINTTVANNVNMSDQPYASILNEGGGLITVRNSIIFAPIIGSNVSQNSFIDGNTNIANGNINTTGIGIADVFTNPSVGDYGLKHPAVINKGSNALFSALDANTKDLAGNARLVGTKIDLGAYEYQQNTIPDANGIIYIKATATGNGDGTSWNDATADLHNAINAPGVTKVFVATGNYNVGSSSFIMKNGVAIYGGFNPTSGITDLTQNRILPTESTVGSVLNGENNRPVIWNNNNGLNNTAILDGFTLTNGNGTSGGAIFNSNTAPVFNNLVIKNSTATTSGGAIYNVNSPIKLSNTIITGNTAQYGGGVRNNGSASEFTNVTIKNNTATLATTGAGGGGIFNENSALKLTNVLIANNSTAFQGGGFRNLSGNPVFTNVTIVNNTANDYFAIDIAAGTPQINNSIILGRVSGNYIPKYSMIVGNADFSSGNIPEFALNSVFTNSGAADYTLKIGSPAVNAGNNALFTGLTADTKDLAGKARVYKYGNGGVIDMGAYESTYSQVVPTSGIAYVKADGTGNGSNWENATSDLHTAIQTAGVSKVFVAKGNYNVGDNSFVMQNGVEIYGGFDPDNNIKTLNDNRIMPNASNTNGSILNGEGARPVIWNVFTSGTAMTNTAILDGFTIFNGSYSNGAGIRNVYASPTLRNLVIRGNASTATGAGIYNENSNPDIYNTVISGNMIIAPFNQSGMGAGIYNGTNAAPTIVNTTLVNNTITGIGASPVMVGAGVANLSSAAPKIYNSIIWNNQKNGVANIAGTDIENISATVTLKNSITQVYSTGNSGDNNKTGNPLFATADFSLQSNSPAVNAGSNSLYTFSGTLDLAGNARNFGSAIDVGAYEYKIVPDANGIVYVKTDGTGSGASWNDATSDLHNAIHTAGVTKVFVAKGNYNVGANSFIMKNGVEIYGGFDPENNIKTLSDNRIMPNPANTNGSVLNGENTRPVIWNVFTSGTAMNNTAVLDGFTVMNGSNATGGGIRNIYASPTLRNLVIRDNKALVNGGAGIYNDNSSPFITNSVIYNNSITDNTGGMGAGIRNVNSSLPTIINCSIIENKLLGTFAPRWGAGITGNAKIYNSIIWGNTRSSTATPDPVDVFQVSVVKNSITQEFTTGSAADNNLVGTDPMFTGASDFSLQAGSPAINMGDNDWFTGLDANTKDLAGNPRVYNFANGGIIDMGTYESTYNTPLAPDANGIIYVTQDGAGNRSGKDWDNATADLHNAIHTTGVTKVFVATGNYKVGSSSFTMKNNVEIYGGFDPASNIKTLTDNRILPTETVGGSVLDGENARPVIWNVFTSGTAMDNTAILDGFTVYNGKYSNGGGIHNEYASPTLRNLVIKNNNASNDGGGMYNDNSSPIITKSIFTENTAGNNGGAMVNDYSYPKLTNVVIKGNQAGFLGGGITSGFDSSPVLTNVLIVQNTAATSGGGIYNGAGKGELVNVTIAGNTPNEVSLNIDKIKNSIIFGEISTVNTLAYSFIQGNTNTNNGNIDAMGITLNDVFNNPSAGDYTLKSTSPVINAGNNALNTTTTDLAGNARVYNNGVIDLGAYESPYNEMNYGPDANGIIYVKENGSGNESGKDWNNASGSLTRAARTNGITKIFAAVGTYNLGKYSLVLKNGMEIYGGFDPANDIDDLNDTRILPNADANIGGSIINGQNAIPIIFNDNNAVDNTAILDGFTLTNGKYATGGGIYNNGASPTLKNLWIKGNTATSDGGGMFNLNSSSPVMSNVTISNNTATYAGGIFNRNNSSPLMTNVVIKTNTATADGGGMYNDVSSSPVMTNVSIIGNTAQNGAGMYNRTNSSPILVNALIAGNTATTNGSAIRNENNSSSALTNTTIANNSGSTALYATNGSTSVANSIVFGTISAGYTPQYSLINGDYNETGSNYSLTDIFTDPTNGDYTLKGTSAVINKGSNTLFSGLDASTKDLAGNARVYNYANSGIIDLGAYEHQGETTLPVTLISFTAKADGNRAKLQWQTVQESNNKGFEIYRAESGKQKEESSDSLTFIKIGEVSALVTYNPQPVTYNFTDNSPLNGNNYYKLVQLDNDGKATDLGIRTVNFQLSTFILQLFPNPTTHHVTLSFGAGTFTQLQVMDLNGRVLQQHKLNATENSKQVSLGAYPTGIYILNLTGNEKTESRKVMKK